MGARNFHSFTKLTGTRRRHGRHAVGEQRDARTIDIARGGDGVALIVVLDIGGEGEAVRSLDDEARLDELPALGGLARVLGEIQVAITARPLSLVTSADHLVTGLAPRRMVVSTRRFGATGEDGRASIYPGGVRGSPRILAPAQAPMKQKKTRAPSFEGHRTAARTDPGFPADWGTRAATGILNTAAPRLDRTTPDFLGVVRDARTSRYAVTLDAFPGTKDRVRDADLAREEETHAVMTGELELGDVGDDHTTVPLGRTTARSRCTLRASTETIDELIDGLPLHVEPSRKRPERRRANGSGKASGNERTSSKIRSGPWPRRPLPALLTPNAPVSRPRQERLVDRAAHHEPERPRALGHTRRVAAMGLALLAISALAVFVFVRLRPHNSEDLADWYKAPVMTTVDLTVSIEPPTPLPPAITLEHPAPVREAPETIAAPVRPPSNAAPHAASGDRPPRAPAARSAIHAQDDELETDVGAASLPVAPVPHTERVPSPDLLTGH